ncbi:MAG TPA: hypothetical protein VIW94_11570 [Acidimicrobiia bacterium]
MTELFMLLLIWLSGIRRWRHGHGSFPLAHNSAMANWVLAACTDIAVAVVVKGDDMAWTVTDVRVCGVPEAGG